MQNLLLPSFFSTMITGNVQLDLDRCIILASSISSTALSIIFLVFKGVRYGLNLIGGWSPVSIFVVTVSVWVKSESFFAKMSKFSSKKLQIKSLCSSGQFNSLISSSSVT